VLTSAGGNKFDVTDAHQSFPKLENLTFAGRGKSYSLQKRTPKKVKREWFEIVENLTIACHSREGLICCGTKEVFLASRAGRNADPGEGENQGTTNLA